MLRAKAKIRKLEKLFLARSRSALAGAFKRSRSSGQSVVISHKGSLYKILPDGSTELLKHLEKPTVVRIGQKVHIR